MQPKALLFAMILAMCASGAAAQGAGDGQETPGPEVCLSAAYVFFLMYAIGCGLINPGKEIIFLGSIAVYSRGHDWLAEAKTILTNPFLFLAELAIFIYMLLSLPSFGAYLYLALALFALSTALVLVPRPLFKMSVLGHLQITSAVSVLVTMLAFSAISSVGIPNQIVSLVDGALLVLVPGLSADIRAQLVWYTLIGGYLAAMFIVARLLKIEVRFRH